jgi:hypothetical protein
MTKIEAASPKLLWAFGFLSIIFHNFTVFRYADRAFTIPDILIPALIVVIVIIGSFNIKRLLLSTGLIFGLPLLSLIVTVSIPETLKSFLPVLLYGTLFILYFSSTNIDKKALVSGFLSAMALIVIFGIFQYVLIKTKMVTERWIVYPFGERTAFGFGLFQGLSSGRWRVNSLFWEPSMLGLFSVTAFLLDYHINRKGKLKKLFYLVGVVLSFSTTAYIVLAACLVYILIPRTKEKLLRTYVLLVILLPFAVLIVDSTPRLVNAFSRVSELSRPKSSGYARISAPLNLSLHVLKDRPLGLGLGAGDHYLRYLAPPDLSHQFAGDKGVHNSFFLLIVWFGYGSLFYFLFYLKLYLSTRKEHSVYLFIMVLFFFLGTGALTMFVNWLFLSLILPLAFEKELITDNNL